MLALILVLEPLCCLIRHGLILAAEELPKPLTIKPILKQIPPNIRQHNVVDRIKGDVMRCAVFLTVSLVHPAGVGAVIAPVLAPFLRIDKAAVAVGAVKQSCEHLNLALFDGAVLCA